MIRYCDSFSKIKSSLIFLKQISNFHMVKYFAALDFPQN